jgi:hypothetical protein
MGCLSNNFRYRPKADTDMVARDVRFSNRPVRVKRFQTTTVSIELGFYLSCSCSTLAPLFITNSFAAMVFFGAFVERLYFIRLRHLARVAVTEARMTPELARARAEQLASFTHFLDSPILIVIVSLGALRLSNWAQFVIGVVIAVAAASLLNYFIPCLYPWGGEATHP